MSSFAQNGRAGTVFQRLLTLIPPQRQTFSKAHIIRGQKIVVTPRPHDCLRSVRVLLPHLESWFLGPRFCGIVCIPFRLRLRSSDRQHRSLLQFPFPEFFNKSPCQTSRSHPFNISGARPSTVIWYSTLISYRKTLPMHRTWDDGYKLTICRLLPTLPSVPPLLGVQKTLARTGFPPSTIASRAPSELEILELHNPPDLRRVLSPNLQTLCRDKKGMTTPSSTLEPISPPPPRR